MSSSNIPRQPISVYSVMLLLAALLMLAACILMAIESIRYGSPWEPTGVPRSAAPVPTMMACVETSNYLL